MSDDFDPYLHWLGIAAHERPADHYRLIGVRRFEDDIPTIEQAADQRMIAIRQKQTGPRAAHTQLILNELSAARLCLLNPAAKAAYDDMLRGFDAAEGHAESVSPPAVDARGEQPQIQVEQRKTPYRKRKPYYANSVFPFVALAAVAGIAAVIWAVGQQLGYRGEQPVPPPRPAPEPFVDFGPMVEQEVDGSLIFLPSTARLSGDVLRRETIDGEDVLVGWDTEDDIATWQFRMARLTRQVRIRATITYSTGGEKLVYRLSIDANTKRCVSRETSGFVTDEHFFAITKTGLHTLKLRGPHAPDLRIKSVVLEGPQ